MDFTLSGESKMMVKAARDFAEQEIEPTVATVEKEDALPDDLLQKFAKARMLGMMVPKEYGGIGSTTVNVVLILEELAKTGSAAAFLMAFCNSVAETIYHWGSEDLRKRFLPPLCDGTNYPAMAFTEPGTGSDPTAITTTATPDGDHYVLNGTKRFVTHGHKKGYGVFYAKDETERITAFMVDKGSEGYTWSKPWALMGLAGQGLVDVFLKDVRAPKEDILGEKGKGFYILLRWIAGERVQQMAFMVGMGQACLDESLRYAKERMVRGRALTAMQGFQWMLADLHASIEACRWWTYRVAAKQDEGGDIEVDSAALKLFVVPTIQEVARKALQIHGSYGYCRDYKIERLYRTIAHAGVTAGSTEIQKTIVGSALARSKGI
ncbi:MAG: acyl-CoA dehydrogenase family protein [Deltaproteobacteria bacterium]|nr:MAG: acyl-CoA dehydrogenase family protein [Deltaproteobacteria bacterium]